MCLGETGDRGLRPSRDGVEVHEPGLEQRPCHRLQRLAYSPVQFDLVVQRAKDVGDGALFVKVGSNENAGLMKVIVIQSWNRRLIGICREI